MKGLHIYIKSISASRERGGRAWGGGKGSKQAGGGNGGKGGSGILG